MNRPRRRLAPSRVQCTQVAHVQFRARIAFKLVWSPVDDYASFVLVDDAGELLATGSPVPPLPSYDQRTMNYRVVQGSKYATAADALDASVVG